MEIACLDSPVLQISKAPRMNLAYPKLDTPKLTGSRWRADQLHILLPCFLSVIRNEDDALQDGITAGKAKLLCFHHGPAPHARFYRLM